MEVDSGKEHLREAQVDTAFVQLPMPGNLTNKSLVYMRTYLANSSVWIMRTFQ